MWGIGPADVMERYPHGLLEEMEKVLRDEERARKRAEAKAAAKSGGGGRRGRRRR